MSIKENIEAIKGELGAQEKFFESFLKIERLYNRYKKVLAVAAVIVFVSGIGYAAYEYKKGYDLAVSNEAYLKLLANQKDEKAKMVLQEKNPALFEAYRFMNAVKQDDKEALKSIAGGLNPYLSDLASYQVAALEAGAQALKNYSYREKALLKDYAILCESYLLLKDGHIQEARARLAQIPEGSMAKGYANLLEHYMVKGDQ